MVIEKIKEKTDRLAKRLAYFKKQTEKSLYEEKVDLSRDEKDPSEEELNVVDEIHQPITERKEDNWTSLPTVARECDHYGFGITLQIINRI